MFAPVSIKSKLTPGGPTLPPRETSVYPPDAECFDVETGAPAATKTELPPEGSKVTGCLRCGAVG